MQLLLFTIFIQGILNYIPETNYVSTVYSVVTIYNTSNVIPMLNVLHFYISTA